MKLTKTQTGVPTLIRDFDDVFDRFLTAPMPFPAFNFDQNKGYPCPRHKAPGCRCCHTCRHFGPKPPSSLREAL